MRQDKDCSGEWLLTHHGDAILTLGGITGFTTWKALQPETVAPRRPPDGLIEVRFPGEAEPTLVLVEIEPNLNLIERLWRFLKRKSVYGKYHPNFAAFRTAIEDTLSKLSTTRRGVGLADAPQLPGVR